MIKHWMSILTIIILRYQTVLEFERHIASVCVLKEDSSLDCLYIQNLVTSHEI